jgi:excisionase family DNA binding protein
MPRTSTTTTSLSPRVSSPATAARAPLRGALTTEEAAEWLGTSRTTVWRLMGRGELRSIRVSARCRRILISELERYVAERAAAAAVPEAAGEGER